MDEYSTIKISKLDAARRQLQTAIELWAKDGDPISIHSLVYAAHQIVHDLKHSPERKDKGCPMFLDNPYIKPEMKGEFIGIVKRDANFFKHSDNRHKKGKKETALTEIDFAPKINELFIAVTINGLKSLVDNLTEYEIAFFSWYSIHRPDLLNETGAKFIEDCISVETISSLRGKSKHEFMEFMVNTIRNAQGHHPTKKST